MGDRTIDGIVNQAGGQTSHAAIIARSRGIPAVSGVSNILKSVHNGDTIIVDGSQGVVLVNPGPRHWQHIGSSNVSFAISKIDWRLTETSHP